MTEHPLDEAAAVLAMRAADRLHRQGEALEVFARLRERLRDELGVDAGEAAVREHARILARDAEAPAGPGLRPVHPGLRVPVPASPTVGREAEVAAVLRALEEGRRLVTVTGPGGVGKSRLLVDVGAALAPDREVVHVALSGHQAGDAQDLAAALAVATGVPLAGDDHVEAVVRALRTSDVTVLVDEAEWVLEPAAALAGAILAGCPRVRLVVTSRVPLSVVGERVLPLSPAAGGGRRAAADRAARRPRAGAGDVDGAGAPGPGRGVPPRRPLPLALELVAGRAAAVPIGDLLDVVERPLDLESDEVGRNDRQLSLRRTISWSVDRLEPEAREALGRLSVFADPFFLPAARAVTGLDAAGTERVVGDLAAAHLLAVERGAAGLAFRLLRTVRDLALEELEAAGDLAATRARHAGWFAGLWRDAPLSDELVEHVGRTYDDHLEALHHLLAAGDADAAADVGLALGRRWLFVEAAGPGLRWTGRLLAEAGLSPRQRARLRVARAAFTQRADWSPAELADITAALAGDADWTCQLFLMTAISAYSQGDVATARAHLDRCRAVAEVGARHHLPEVIATGAALDAADGRPAAALAAVQQVLARVGANATAVDLVGVLPKAALALLDAERPREALDLLTRSATEAQSRFGIRPTGTIAVNAGWAALAVGEPDIALGWFGRALVGPHAFVVPAALGEAAVGAGTARAALPDADGSEVAELLGLGQWLLDQAGYVLPPSLAAPVAGAVARTGSTTPPPGWTDDDAVARIAQLVAS